MTTFSKLGFKEGDEFLYTGNCVELRGKTFQLTRDDGSFCPYFKCLSSLRLTQYPQDYVFCFDKDEISPTAHLIEANE